MTNAKSLETPSNKHSGENSGYYTSEACDLAEFVALTEQTCAAGAVPFAADIQKEIPLYDVPSLSHNLKSVEGRRQLMAEWAQVLQNGPGVLVLKQAQPQHETIDAATEVFETIIAKEKAAGGAGADHFAAAGSNDRIWNSLQKLCLVAPELHAKYFATPAIDAVAEAWLGPNYQMTAQINLVHPGGQAQQAHRDYHLGFQTAEISATYPAHVHDLSPLMTLQGGIAHCDMPIESGPTKLLPFSQLYRPGYAAWRRPDFRAYFEARHVQLPLEKGDAIFFSPALFHAAGENYSSDVHRMVNLLQISSAFGRAMESLDRTAMCKAVFPFLSKLKSEGHYSELDLNAVIAATAEGYSFPTNLDQDPPEGGLAPETQAALLQRALKTEMSQDALAAALDLQKERRRP